MNKKRILVFPCGSEVGLEIYRSLRYSRHFELIGGSSTKDHGEFIFNNYIGDIPFLDDIQFIPELKRIVEKQGIDAIYPTMDKVICKLKELEKELGCIVISSPKETTRICLFKNKTYGKLKNVVHVPHIYETIKDINKYPVFIKPNIGYGSRGTFKADSVKDIEYFFSKKDYSEHIISEYLEGEEYTVDCFTDRKGILKFCGPRVRQRIRNGISVNTKPVRIDLSSFHEMAKRINNALEMRGAWFFQLKKNEKNILFLMEIASRLGGSSSLYRAQGVNFALLSTFDAFDIDVEIASNNFYLELDRALENKYKIDLFFSTVYVDFDDCLIIDNRINTELVQFLYSCLNRGKKLIIISKHEGDLEGELRKYRLINLFDEIIHLDKDKRKIDYINPSDSIFIDDSFSERLIVQQRLGIPVFGLDNIEALSE